MNSAINSILPVDTNAKETSSEIISDNQNEFTYDSTNSFDQNPCNPINAHSSLVLPLQTDLKLANGNEICMIKSCYYQFKPDEERGPHIKHHFLLTAPHQCNVCTFGCETKEEIAEHEKNSHFSF